MTEELPEGPAPAPPGPVPTWMMFVGCGCLVPGFLLVSAAAYFMQQMGGLLDQNHAWESLAELIEYDESVRGTPSGEPDNPKTSSDESRTPGEFTMWMGGELPISEGRQEFFWLGRDVTSPLDKDFTAGPDALLVTFAKMPSRTTEDATKAPPGTPKHEDRRIEVQGQSLRMRVIPEMVMPEVGIPGVYQVVPERRGAGAAVWVREGFKDGEDDELLFDLLAYFMRPGSRRSIEPDEVRHFLEPYRVPPREEPAGEEPAGEKDEEIAPRPGGAPR